MVALGLLEISWSLWLPKRERCATYLLVIQRTFIGTSSLKISRGTQEYQCHFSDGICRSYCPAHRCTGVPMQDKVTREDYRRSRVGVSWRALEYCSCSGALCVGGREVLSSLLIDCVYATAASVRACLLLGMLKCLIFVA